MKDASEITTHLKLIVELITKCNSKCYKNIPAKLCPSCAVLKSRYEGIKWVLEKESKLQRIIDTKREKSNAETQFFLPRYSK